MWQGFKELLQGEKHFLKYNKQTILHLLYRILLYCFVLDFSILLLYVFASADKSFILIGALRCSGYVTAIDFGFIIIFHCYFIFLKKDIKPLQSEETQVVMELITRVGDSDSGLTIEDIATKLIDDGKDINKDYEE